MTATYFHTLFGDAARQLQEHAGSREAYSRMEAPAGPGGDPFTEKEIAFLEARDSFYLATVTADGWPYVQHRGGAPGFVQVLGPQRIAFREFPGNRQFISHGNLVTNDRVALFFMDYPARRRLKLIGHATMLDSDGDGSIVIDVIGFDWNCPKHITPRYSFAEIEQPMAALRDENALLRAEILRLQGGNG